jgi:hypothetical protein
MQYAYAGMDAAYHSLAIAAAVLRHRQDGPAPIAAEALKRISASPKLYEIARRRPAPLNRIVEGDESMRRRSGARSAHPAC